MDIPDGITGDGDLSKLVSQDFDDEFEFKVGDYIHVKGTEFNPKEFLTLRVMGVDIEGKITQAGFPIDDEENAIDLCRSEDLDTRMIRFKTYGMAEVGVASMKIKEDTTDVPVYACDILEFYIFDVLRHE